ncbi:hypothetical protein [Bartonella sp. B17]
MTDGAMTGATRNTTANMMDNSNVFALARLRRCGKILPTSLA